jgi:hypothetical protein
MLCKPVRSTWQKTMLAEAQLKKEKEYKTA